MKVKPRVKKVNYQGTDCYLPQVVVEYCGKPCPHKVVYSARGVLLTRRGDAQSSAENWARECIEVGYVTR